MVKMVCPRCGVGHLEAAVYIDAEAGDLFEVVGPDGESDDRVLVRRNPAGRLQDPEEVILVCEACDWTDDRFITWVEG